MKTIRLLIVEDDPALLANLKRLYREIFTTQGYDSVTIEEAKDGPEAMSLARGAVKLPYDLVSLDVNLGNADVTGLHILGALKRFKSAWMVALLTGIETEGASLDRAVGREEAERMRKQLRKDAYARFWAERLLVVEKPSLNESEHNRAELLANRLRDIASVYTEVARQRYIFRPITVEGLSHIPKSTGNDKFVKTRKTVWQVRFNCGDIRTVEETTGFETLRELLRMGSEDVLSIQRAMVVEPKKGKGSKRLQVLIAESTNDFAKHFNKRGIKWSALSVEQQGNMALQLGPKLRRYVKLRQLQTLDASEKLEMEILVTDLGPLAEKAFQYNVEADAQEEDQVEGEVYSQAAVRDAFNANEIQIAGSNLERRAGGWGKDGPDRWNFSARKKRTIDALRRDGFLEFADHIDAYIMPNKGKWSYNPPHPIEWTTA